MPPVMTPVTPVLMSPGEAAVSFRRAARGVEGLVGAIDANRNGVSSVVSGLRDDLVALVTMLNKVAVAVRSSECELALGEDARFLIFNCDRICQKHARNIRLLHQDHITTLKVQLSGFKNILNTILQTSGCLNAARQEHMTKEMVDPMLKQMEKMIERQILGVRTEQGALARYNPPRNVSNRDEILTELKHQRKTYEAMQKICEEALKKTVHQRTGQKIFRVHATEKSVTLTGFINSEEEESRIDQEISDVSATDYSISAVGVVKKIDYEALAEKMGQIR